MLPGVDSLNHARATPVSWVVSYPEQESGGEILSFSNKEPAISLVIHTPADPGQELFNNYGAKPNSELIVGYGFSISDNPDDTIILKIWNIQGKKWEIGRNARGAEGIWEAILALLMKDSPSPATYEDQLDAAGMLADMVQDLIDRLPPSKTETEMRPEVASMLHDYVEGESGITETCSSSSLTHACSGQRDILLSMIAFAREKEQIAMQDARDLGIDIVLEDED